MELVNNYVNVLKNYVGFSGRARRREYWLFILANFIVSLVISIIGTAIKLPILSTIYALAIFLPSLAVLIRRLHDIGKAGVWFLISLIPCVGGIWLIVLLCQDSMPGTNEFGANPKDVVDSNYM